MRNYQGTIHSIRGSVLDMRFGGELPPLRRRLLAGDRGNVIIEVLTHESNQIARGDPVIDIGGELTVPTGRALPGRMLIVFDTPIDIDGEEALQDNEWRSTHCGTLPCFSSDHRCGDHGQWPQTIISGACS